MDDCDDGVCLLVEEMEGEFGIGMDGFLCGRGVFFGLTARKSRERVGALGLFHQGYY